MLLKRLTLHNYTIFQGTHTLTLEPRESPEPRNVILIGGKNGAGKTSILEALRLALYGPLALNGKGGRDAYSGYLIPRINQHALGQGEPTAWVEVALAVVVDNLLTEITLRRTWTVKDNGKVHEDFNLVRDGVAQSSLAAQQIEEFLRDLVPPGVSEFFFFDGEQIQRLAVDEAPPPSFIAALRSLLDLDLIDRLGADLGTVAREARHTAKGQAAQELRAAEARHEKSRQSLEASEAEAACLQASLAELREEEARLEKELQARGVLLAEERQRLNEEKIHVSQRQREIQQDLNRLASDVIPLLLAGDVLREMESQLHKERELRQWAGAQALIGRFHEELLRELSRLSRKGGPLTPETADVVRAVAQELWEKTFPTEQPDRDVLHALGDREEEDLVAQVRTLRLTDPKNILDLLDEAEGVDERLRQIEHERARLPAETAEGDLLEGLANVRSQIPKVSVSIGRQVEQRDRLQRELLDAERAVTKAQRFLQLRDRARAKIGRIDKVQRILSGFAKEITQSRIREISTRATDMHHHLARKEGRIGQIQMDSKTLEIRLLDREGSALSKERLSAGEKQIYAVAMLHGLAQASGRRLPVIIDTPLGRFDSDHKHSVVARYFPIASHQVILLATDTEMDPAHYGLLEPFVSHTLLLDYRNDVRATVVRDGYFWGIGEIDDAGQQA